MTTSEPALRKCHICGQMVPSDKKRCKGCGELLGKVSDQPRPVLTTRPASPASEAADHKVPGFWGKLGLGAHHEGHAAPAIDVASLPLIEKYDAATNTSRVEIPPVIVVVPPKSPLSGKDIKLAARFSFKGQELTDLPKSMLLGFVSDTVDGKLGNCHELTLLVDDEYYYYEDVKHFKDSALDSVLVSMSYKAFRSITTAERVDATLSETRIPFTDDMMTVLHKLLHRMTPARHK